MAAHSSIYEVAALYDLAFSYRDCAAEARFLRLLFAQRRGRSAASFLELAAGPAQHAVEMLREGLHVTALDLSPYMASYGRRKAEALGLTLDYVVGDMARFEVPQELDLIACMLCSASYLLTADDFVSHLECVRAALGPDGMYVLELTHPSELTGAPKPSHSWKMRDADGELDILWGGDPARAVDGIWNADVRLVYRPFDGSAPTEVHDEAPQRGYTFPQLAHFAERAGLHIEAAFGAFDENVPLHALDAQRMILALRKDRADQGNIVSSSTP